MVLNFRDVTYLDSFPGLDDWFGRCTRRGNNAELRAVELNAAAAEILKLTNLHTVFSDYPTESAALSSFTRSRSKFQTGKARDSFRRGRMRVARKFFVVLFDNSAGDARAGVPAGSVL